MHRRAVRYGAAATAAVIALIYFLIGFGVLTVVMPSADDPSMAFFGFSVVWGYVAVAVDRTPAFEFWGIASRITQIPLFAALVYLVVRRPVSRSARW